MDTEVRNILVGMKAELSKGWIQGEMGNEKGVCLFGSLITSTALPASYSPTGVKPEYCVSGRADGTPGIVTHVYGNTPAYYAMESLSDELGIPIKELALWNDAPERTHQDIVDVIDRVLLKDEQNAEGSDRLQRLDSASGNAQALEESRSS